MNYTVLISSILLVSVIIGISIWFLESRRRLETVKNFTSYASILVYHMEKAYELIHKDRILIYSLEATKLPDKEFERVTKEFIALSIKMLGPKLVKDLSYLYGNEQTLLFNMTDYFNTRYEEDEIRKGTIEEMMEQEVATEGEGIQQ